MVDGSGAVLRREVLASDPDVIAKWFGRYCPNLLRVVLETGPLSAFLYHGMVARDVPVKCICARQAKGVLSARVNKSDVHDAEGIDGNTSGGSSAATKTPSEGISTEV